MNDEVYVVATAVCATVCVHTHSVSHAHFSDTFSLRGVQTSHTHGSRCLQCACHTSPSHPLHSHVSSTSLLFPHGHFNTSFPSAPSLPNCSRSVSAGPAHFRTSGEEFGHLADPTHSTKLRSIIRAILCFLLCLDMEHDLSHPAELSHNTDYLQILFSVNRVTVDQRSLLTTLSCS